MGLFGLFGVTRVSLCFSITGQCGGCLAHGAFFPQSACKAEILQPVMSYSLAVSVNGVQRLFSVTLAVVLAIDPSDYTGMCGYMRGYMRGSHIMRARATAPSPQAAAAQAQCERHML